MAKRGRKPKTIDFVQFEKLCGYHLSLKNIAEFFEVSQSTIKRLCKQKYGMNFDLFSEQKRAKYKGYLLGKFWKKVDDGNMTAIIFGLKNILNWHDNMDISTCDKKGFKFTGV